MKLHRFYVKELHDKYGPIPLGKTLWIHDEAQIHQWLRVLRMTVGSQLVLFNDTEERLYVIKKVEPYTSVQLSLVTEFERQIPKKELYLFWSILKRDKNDWVLQKGTELGVHSFIPIHAHRSEKQGFSVERAGKIVIEAAEQCGRATIPYLREPILVNEALREYAEMPLFICEQHEDSSAPYIALEKLGVFIGPEGGWSDEEKSNFKDASLHHVALSQFTLRAETAAVVAAAKLMEPSNI